jgi:hypothetical protein
MTARICQQVLLPVSEWRAIFRRSTAGPDQVTTTAAAASPRRRHAEDGPISLQLPAAAANGRPQRACALAILPRPGHRPDPGSRPHDVLRVRPGTGVSSWAHGRMPGKAVRSRSGESVGDRDLPGNRPYARFVIVPEELAMAIIAPLVCGSVQPCGC